MPLIIPLSIYALTRTGFFGNNFIDLNDSSTKKFLCISHINFVFFSYCTYWKDVPRREVRKIFFRPTYINHNGYRQYDIMFWN